MYINRRQIALSKTNKQNSNIWKKEKLAEWPTLPDFNIMTKIIIQHYLYCCQDKELTRIQFRNESSQAYWHGMVIDVSSIQ